VRVRDGHGGGPERGTYPRRLWVLNGIRRGALLPGRSADDRRRGNQRDSAERHRLAAGSPRRAHNRSSILIGSFRIRRPVAWNTAFPMAAATPTIDTSPNPLTPTGFRMRSGLSTKATSIS